MLKKIDKAAYQTMVAEGEVLESEAKIPKVILLPERRILKLFRRKRLLSSQMWITHAARFVRNAKSLHNMGIPTVEIVSTFNIPSIERQAVLYKMREGDTLRNWLETNSAEDCLIMMDQLGIFVGKLHHRGILFRSIHLANLVVQPDGTLCLIDIADVGFRLHGSLSVSQRIRNFHHMNRHEIDQKHLSGMSGERFMKSYLSASKFKEKQKSLLRRAFAEIFNIHGKGNI
jgi:tRNA A-37 threonylcarbamoyl transferase component Bud32